MPVCDGCCLPPKSHSVLMLPPPRPSGSNSGNSWHPFGSTKKKKKVFSPTKNHFSFKITFKSYPSLSLIIYKVCWFYYFHCVCTYILEGGGYDVGGGMCSINLSAKYNYMYLVCPSYQCLILDCKEPRGIKNNLRVSFMKLNVVL